jgi:hypothetical protein
MRRRLAPGVWEDANEDLHFSLPELLDFFELENNPANQAHLDAMIRKLIAENIPKTTIIERE